MSTGVKVTEIRHCDVCRGQGKESIAYADAKLNIGPWANVCSEHFVEFECELGAGRGQVFVYAE